MSVKITGNTTNTDVEVDTNSKAMRITQYDITGKPLKNSETFKGIASTFRCIGSAGVPQNLFTMENNPGSGKLVYLRGLYLYCDTTAALLTVSCQVDVGRTTTIPSGGTVMTKIPMDTTLSSNSSIVLRSGASADGTNSVITATKDNGYIWRSFISRQATAVGQVQQSYPIQLVPNLLFECDSLILREGQAFVVQITGTAASNAATNHYIVNAIWDEV